MMTPHLARGGKTTIKITLIHNPSAGDDSQPSGERIVEMIESAGHKVKYQSSKEKDWKKALKKRCDIIRDKAWSIDKDKPKSRSNSIDIKVAPDSVLFLCPQKTRRRPRRPAGTNPRPVTLLKEQSDVSN